MPLDMEKQHPNIWQNDEDEGGKNMYEEDFLYSHIQRLHKPVKFSYTKILNYDAGRELMENVHNTLGNYLNAVRSEEHTSELQSLMRTSYAVFCLTKQHVQIISKKN